MKLKINITKDVLRESMNCGYTDESRNKVGQNCAIGTAIYKLFGEMSWVGPSGIVIYPNGVFGKGSYSFIIDLPDDAIDFIRQFDFDEPIERLNHPEFSFEIEVPEEVINLIGIDQVHEVLSTSKTMELV